MSEKFGLDWKDHDFTRMEIFWQIMISQNERAERDKQKTGKMR